MRHIPNILSFLRLAMVGVFVWAFRTGRYDGALSVYVFAFLTDILDGDLARRYHWVSNVGKLLDPLADKIMTVTALVCIYLGKRQTVYLVLFLLVGVKELLMLLGGILMVRRKIVAFADWIGKCATGLFALGIVLTLLSFSNSGMEPWSIGVLTAATVLAYGALVHYGVSQFSGIFRKNGVP